MLSLDSRVYQNCITDHVDTYNVVVVEDLSINLLFQLSSMDFVHRLMAGDLPLTTYPLAVQPMKTQML